MFLFLLLSINQSFASEKITGTVNNVAGRPVGVSKTNEATRAISAGNASDIVLNRVDHSMEALQRRVAGFYIELQRPKVVSDRIAITGGIRFVGPGQSALYIIECISGIITNPGDIETANVPGGTTSSYNSTFLPAANQPEKNINQDLSLAIFALNRNIDPVSTKNITAAVLDPIDIFDPLMSDGKATSTMAAGQPNLPDIFPALRKNYSKKFAYTCQYRMGDMPVIRLGDIYLVAAEAALFMQGDQGKAAQYMNIIPKEAATTVRENNMVALPSEMRISFLLISMGRN